MEGLGRHGLGTIENKHWPNIENLGFFWPPALSPSAGVWLSRRF